MNVPKEIIEKFLEDNFQLKKTSTGEIRINSPFEKDGKYHCYINTEKSKFIDYKSGLQGSFIYFIKEYLNLKSTKEAELHVINQYYNIEDLYIKEPKSKLVIDNIKTELIIPNNLKFFDENVSYSGTRALNYLLSRKYSLEKIKEYKLGYCFDGEYAGRIFVPFYENGDLVYFLTRTFEDSPIRYKNPHSLDSKEFVFNIDRLGNTVVLVEGVFDAMTINYPTATALLSADISRKQIEKILNKKPKNIIFVPDNDKTGKKTLEKNWKMFKTYEDIESKINYYVYNITGGFKDINEANISYISIDDCSILDKKYFTETLYD